MNKDLFAREAIAQIPKILTLLDRNPHSPTYGCFDRSFWQYKVLDFPSGMSQEFVYPLALAYYTDIDNNPFYHQSVIIDWVEAGILYAAKSSHPDGSCDDYFPYERAGGAAAFSLLACIESYTLMGLNNPEILRFFVKRADWLAHHQESGRLTNHQALIVLCLELLSRLLQDNRWDKSKQERLEQVLSWQNPEGWFQEYEGCDPGYHTLTISCLARVYELNPSNPLKDAIAKAVILASQFVHPDGSYGGEYTSRNTYNFFPHGFELVGKWMPEALNINDRFLQGLAKGLAPCYADDRIIGHHTWNYLLTWRDYIGDRPEIKPHPPGRFYLEEGGEGGTIEYAITALGIEQVIICGHSHCGAMKGLLKLNKLQADMPLVYDWLKHAEATRRLVLENYPDQSGEELIETLVAENVLIQIDNLKTYPMIKAKMHQGKLNIYGWIYEIETGEVLAYDDKTHTYLPPQSQLLDEDDSHGARFCNVESTMNSATLKSVRAKLEALLTITPHSPGAAQLAMRSLKELFEEASELGMNTNELRDYHSLFAEPVQTWARKVYARVN